MKENTLKQQNAMKDQTFGVEIEMFNIKREDAIRTIARHFGNELTVEYFGGGYYGWHCYDTQGREWKVQRDVSIQSWDDEKKAEMITPILTYNDLEPLQDIVRELRKAGAKSNPKHMCGVHVHIGANGHTPKSLRNLANLMASHESLLISAMRLDSERISNYCRTVDPRFLEQLNSKKPKTMDELKAIWYKSQDADYGTTQHYNPSRYHMLNLHATFTKGTIEFRCFQFANPDPESKHYNGIHAGELKSYIQLCMALSEEAKELRSASPKEPQHDNPKFAMRTWLIRLGMVGDEFETARDILTKNLSGDGAFRYGREEFMARKAEEKAMKETECTALAIIPAA